MGQNATNSSGHQHHSPAHEALAEIHRAYATLGRDADELLALIQSGRASEARQRTQALAGRQLEDAQRLLEEQHQALIVAHRGSDHIVGQLAWLALGIAIGSMLLSLGGTLAFRSGVVRRREADGLRRSEARFRALIERAPVALAVHRGGRVLYVNPALAVILGRDADTLVGTELADVADGAMLIGFAGANSSTREQRRVCRPDGTVELLEIEEVCLEFDGHPARCVLARDVTERNQLRAQLAIADRMVALGTLAAGIGHEINNPLSYVMSNLSFVADSLRSGASSPEQLQEPLDEAIEGATRIRDIVRDFKRFSNGEQDSRELVDVRHALEFAIKMAHNEIRHRAHLVRVFDEDVPRVLANDSRLGQVFLNLLLNAAHAIPMGAAESNEIRITVTTRNRAVVIEVQDSGEGIAEHFIGRIFEPFFTTRSSDGGMGLGLAISHRIVTELEGTITVHSTRGRGTTFCVSLPVEETKSMTDSIRSRDVMSLPLRILLIDDDAMVRRSIQRILSRKHEVIPVASGREALSRIRAGERFDVVLSDLMMPEMSGIEFFRRLCADHSEMSARVIFLSGGAFTPEAVNFLGSVPNRQLEKPFDPAAFELAVASTIPFGCGSFSTAESIAIPRG